MPVLSAVSLHTIDDAEALRSFEPEWQDFLRRVPPPTPFHTPEWLLTWWSHFGSGTPHVLVFRHYDEVAGVMPCFLHEWNGRQQMTLMGSGISDCLDPVFDFEHLDGIVESLQDHLSTWRDWEICVWQDLSADTPLRAIAQPVDDTACSEVALDRPFEEFLDSRPRELTRNLRHCREKSAVLGMVELGLAHEADEELVTALIDLHAARWQEAGQSGMIAANGSAGFLRDVARRLAPRDMLRLFWVKLSGRAVAVLFALSNRTTLFSYIPAFDPAYKKLGFGHLLHEHAFRYAHENGYQTWNFLRGEEPYKVKWGAQPIPKCRIMIQRS